VLGLLIDQERPVSSRNLGEASLYLTQLHGFDPLAELEEDHVMFGVPLVDLSEAKVAQAVMFESNPVSLRDELS